MRAQAWRKSSRAHWAGFPGAERLPRRYWNKDSKVGKKQTLRSPKTKLFQEDGKRGTVSAVALRLTAQECKGGGAWRMAQTPWKTAAAPRRFLEAFAESRHMVRPSF